MCAEAWLGILTFHAPALSVSRLSSAGFIDGEGVVCDPDGMTDFDLLRAALGHKGSRAFLFAFDVLELDGRDLAASPWDERRKALTKHLRKARDDRPYRSGRCPDRIKVKNPDAPAANRLIEG